MESNPYASPQSSRESAGKTALALKVIAIVL
jgi:hypothetical protein